MWVAPLACALSQVQESIKVKRHQVAPHRVCEARGRANAGKGVWILEGDNPVAKCNVVIIVIIIYHDVCIICCCCWLGWRRRRLLLLLS